MGFWGRDTPGVFGVRTFGVLISDRDVGVGDHEVG